MLSRVIRNMNNYQDSWQQMMYSVLPTI